MDAVMGIFGGKKESTSSTPTDLTPDAYASLRPQLASLLSGLAGGGIPRQPGPSLSVTPEQRSLLDGLARLGGGQGSGQIGATASGAYLPSAPTAGATWTGPEYRGTNPLMDAYTEAAQRRTKTALDDTLSRTLPGTFTAAGQTISGGLRSPNANLKPGSTAFDLAAARAFEGGANALGDIATNIGFQAGEAEAGRQFGSYENERARQQAAYDAERQRQLTAVGLGQQEVQTMVSNLEAQSVPVALSQYGYEQGVARSNEQLNQLLQTLAMMQGTAAPVIGNVQQGSSTTQPNVFASLFPYGFQRG